MGGAGGRRGAWPPVSCATSSSSRRRTAPRRTPRALAIPLLADDVPWEIDLTIDGADEVDPALDLVKGGGGALLREKMVAQASRREVIVVDDTKPSPALGTRFALPVEVIEFGLATTEQFLRGLGATPTLREDGDRPYRTDSGNLIVDAAFGPIADPAALARTLADHAGVVEHGLFVGLTDTLVIGHLDGTIHGATRRRRCGVWVRISQATLWHPSRIRPKLRSTAPIGTVGFGAVRSVAGRVAVLAVVWTAVLLVTRVAGAPAEHCPPSDPATLRHGIDEALDWFTRNQQPDGSWLFQYDAAAGRDLGGYDVVHHAGAVEPRCGRPPVPASTPRGPGGRRRGVRQPAPPRRGRLVGDLQRQRAPRDWGIRAVPGRRSACAARSRAPPTSTARCTGWRRSCSSRPSRGGRCSPSGSRTARRSPAITRRSPRARCSGRSPSCTSSSRTRAGTSRRYASAPTSLPSATTARTTCPTCPTTGPPTGWRRWRGGRAPTRRTRCPTTLLRAAGTPGGRARAADPLGEPALRRLAQHRAAGWTRHPRRPRQPGRGHRRAVAGGRGRPAARRPGRRPRRTGHLRRRHGGGATGHRRPGGDLSRAGPGAGRLAPRRPHPHGRRAAHAVGHGAVAADRRAGPPWSPRRHHRPAGGARDHRVGRAGQPGPGGPRLPRRRPLPPPATRRRRHRQRARRRRPRHPGRGRRSPPRRPPRQRRRPCASPSLWW